MDFLIRADASPKIGSGHVMRILGLAQGLRRQGHGVSFLHSCPWNLRDRLRSQGFESVGLNTTPGSPEDADATTRRAREVEADWVVADGYVYSSVYQRRIMESGFRILLVDDNGHADGYPADLVLNQSLHADPSLYAEGYDDQRFLLGSDYALFREEFHRWIGHKRIIENTAKRLLVSLGGLPDPRWLSRVLTGLSDLDLDISVAGDIPLSSRDHLAPDASFTPLPDVKDMADLIMSCDIGLTAGGGTAKEFLFLGLPFAVVEVADNQELQSRFLGERGLASRLGPIGTLDERELSRALQSLVDNHSQRVRVSEAGQLLVDGRGVDRVVERLTTE